MKDFRRRGPRTASVILDTAEAQFARHGYTGTSLRLIAAAAGLREPGIYNHFDSKEALYTAVLQRALDPIGKMLAEHLARASTLPDFIELPAQLADHLARHPQVAALLQRALLEEAGQPGNALLHRWLAALFDTGLERLATFSDDMEVRRETLAINLIALFNIITGYFTARQAFLTLGAGDPQGEANLQRQKQLLHRVIRAMMVN
ncbi:TetR family transcriptional regulator [Parahaliea mediterranea]|uniref:TetR/AcrR family transcriptional regulator n=1 Tax=Parahaliea mediterranea TaxID=651086 RepID=A0A939DI50_9GAMM|nr:TetR/AcrR family transcriptional regulator [Parahaliea mediterranea]